MRTLKNKNHYRAIGDILGIFLYAFMVMFLWFASIILAIVALKYSSIILYFTTVAIIVALTQYSYEYYKSLEKGGKK